MGFLCWFLCNFRSEESLLKGKLSLWIFIKLLKNGFSLKIFISNLHSWCDRIVVLGFSVLFFSQFEWKVIQSSHNLVNPSLWSLSLRISHIWRFWVLEDLESSAKKNSVKIFSQFLKFSVFRAQFSGSHFGNSQFHSFMPLSRGSKST